MSTRRTTDRTIADIVAATGLKGRAREALEEVVREAADRENKRCIAVMRLCFDAGLPMRAAEMIQSGRTVDEVAELVKRAAVNAKWDRTISNTGLAN